MPCPADIPRRQPTGGKRFPQTVGTVITPRGIENIRPVVTIPHRGKKRHETIELLFHTVIRHSGFNLLLQQIGVKKRYTPAIPLVTESLITGFRAVRVTQFLPSHHVQRVYSFIKRSVIIHHYPLVIIQHRIFTPVIKSPLGHHHLGRISRHIRVLVQKFVPVPNRGIACRPVSLRRVGIIIHPVFPCRLHVTNSPQHFHVQPFQRPEFQFRLEFRIQHIDLQLVRFQLVQNTERGIIHRVILVITVIVISPQCPARVQRVTERVDIEITFHLPANGIRSTAVRTRCILHTQ